MRILLVSQMYPGPDAPDYGVFVRDLADAVERRGHEIERVVVDRRGAGLARRACPACPRSAGAPPGRRLEPLPVPDRGSPHSPARAPLLVTAHGQDVRNIGMVRGVAAATRFVARRAAAIVAVSDYLRRELEERVPEARGRVEVVDSGVDLTRFAPADPAAARAELGWEGDGPAFVCVGGLDKRKNVLRLAAAFERLGEGRLAFVGDGPLRAQLEGRPGIRLAGRVEHDRVARWLAAADVVCQPSLVEPFGQAILEAMASARSWQRRSAGRPSSCRRRPACWSTRSTRRRSPRRCARRPRCRARTTRRGLPRPSTT